MSAPSTAAEPRTESGALRWLVAPLALLAAASILLASVDSLRLIEKPFPGFLVWDNGVLVQFHTDSWTGAQSGLPMSRGRIVSVDGRPFQSGRALLGETALMPVGSPVRYGIEADGIVRTHVVPTMKLDFAGWAATFGAYLANGTFFFLIALIALYMRPELREARALALVGGSVALVFVLAADYLATCRLPALSLLAEAAAPASVAYFSLVFPSLHFGARTRRTLMTALLASLGFLVTAELLLFRSNPRSVDMLALIPNGLMAIFSLLVLVRLGHAFVTTRDAVERLRAGVVFAGGFAALTLPAIGILSLIILDWEASFTWLTAPALVFPISILYAVVRHDLLGAERFIRLTVGYAFATSGVVLGYAVFVSLLGHAFATDLSTNPAAAFALLIGLGVSFEPMRRRVQTTVDRLFFMSRVDAAAVLERSSVVLAGLRSPQAIARAVEQQLGSALGLASVRLEIGPSAVSEQPNDHPVIFGHEVLGTIRCGPKRSGAPFSEAELDLVEGMANQVALALYNANTLAELERTQAKLLRNERLAAIGEFAGAVAHGIRNPLAGIRAATQIASERAEDGPMADRLRSITEEVDRLELRVRSLLDFSKPRRPGEGRVEIGELVLAVERAVRAKADEQGVTIEHDLPEQAVWITTDAHYLEEALLELVGNALNAMPGGGTLSLEAVALQNREAVTLRVGDSGPGIAESVQDRVFDLFFTTREQGTGIGLARVKRTAEELGGSVALERSEPGATVFRIDLG